MPFAVLDFETTGLIPERNDRVIEVAVVLTNGDGLIEREWTTLVNPHRDVGATRVHGLLARDLLDAPEFGDIADQILALIAGRTIVAHNAGFDMRFLYAELTRAGYAISEQPSALCTMKWSGKFIGPAKLSHICDALNVELMDAHSALGDARATAMVLAHLACLANREKEWAEDVARSQRFRWPTLQGRLCANLLARGERKTDTRAWLDVVLSNSCIPGVPEDEASYLLALERALLDRNVSITEARELEIAAKDAGLDGSSVARVHLAYLQSAAHEALVDGVITAEERGDLLTIAALLGLTDTDVDKALACAATKQAERANGSPFSLTKGDRIVFTGETSRSRDAWIVEIKAAGLTSGAVTKSTKLVVAADPDSMSGKAAKARSYGIPIIDEKTFVRLFQEYCTGC